MMTARRLEPVSTYLVNDHSKNHNIKNKKTILKAVYIIEVYNSTFGMHKQLNWNVFETNESETTISQFLFNHEHLVWAWKRYIRIW